MTTKKSWRSSRIAGGILGAYAVLLVLVAVVLMAARDSDVAANESAPKASDGIEVPAQGVDVNDTFMLYCQAGVLTTHTMQDTATVIVPDCAPILDAYRDGDSSTATLTEGEVLDVDDTFKLFCRAGVLTTHSMEGTSTVLVPDCEATIDAYRAGKSAVAAQS